MSSLVVALCYGSAMALSLALLWYWGTKTWYWHLLSVCLALILGLTPLPEALNTKEATLAVGWVFVFLFIWGLAAPMFALSHHHPHWGHHAH